MHRALTTELEFAPASPDGVPDLPSPTHGAGLQGGAPDPDRLERATRELYHQINFLADVDASSRAVEDALTPIDNDGLDEAFAGVASGLLSASDRVADGCRESLDACHESRSLLDSSVTAMATIHGKLSGLVESIAQVAEVTSSIERLARTTSIVSMNAQVEAARAGEAGQGFAVVADEVGRLAQSIRTDSDQIEGVLERITRFGEEVNSLIVEEQERVSHQDHALTGLVERSEELMVYGETLPAMVGQLDRFLEPLELARGAIEHNRHIRIAADNLTRNVRGIHGALSEMGGSSRAQGSGVHTLEGFTDLVTDHLTLGEDLPIEKELATLLERGHGVQLCLDAVGKAVQTVNMRQKYRNVSVGESYFNFLVVERALDFLESEGGAIETVDMPVVLGNARGDFHSLGRRMVGMFLRANGIHVIDVGLGAEVDSFVEAVVQSGARVVGVSSLLVDSAKEIGKLRLALDGRGLRSTKIVAGGACFVVDRDFYKEVGADYVATAASDMVGLTHQIYAHNPMRARTA